MPSSPSRIAVLGVGRSGRAAAALARAQGAEVHVFDDGHPEPLQSSLDHLHHAGFTTHIGPNALTHPLSPGDYDLVILSPGIDENWPLPRRFTAVGIPLTGETEYAFRFTSTPIIAITGTNGKSTCTELIATILNGNGLRSLPCGNHGMPLSEVLLSGHTYDVLALEISSFQLETIDTFHPRVALWLNFAADHLDRYPDLDSYFSAKARIFNNLTRDDLAIVHAAETVDSRAARRLTFSAYDPDADAFFTGTEFVSGHTVLARTESLPLRGRHNMENVLAAVLACRPFGIEPQAAVDALAAYGVPRHRCEHVRTLAGRDFINDSKATNVHAVQACIKALDEPLVLIVGGFEKNLDYSPLAPLLPGRVRALVAIGQTAPRLMAQFSAVVPCHHAPDMGCAVQTAWHLSEPGDAVVLSPGTSSFDMFTGYAQRGDAFCTAVQQLN